MTIVLLDDGGGSAFASTAVSAVNVAEIPVGSLVVVLTGDDVELATLTSVADDQGNTYVDQAEMVVTGGGGYVSTTAYSFITSALSVGENITATWSSGTVALRWAAFSGLVAVDQQNQDQNASFPPSSPLASGDITTTAPNELLVGFNSAEGAGITFTETALFTEIGEWIAPGDVWQAQLEYRVVSSIDTYAVGPTPSAPCYWNSRIISFLADTEVVSSGTMNVPVPRRPRRTSW